MDRPGGGDREEDDQDPARGAGPEVSISVVLPASLRAERWPQSFWSSGRGPTGPRGHEFGGGFKQLRTPAGVPRTGMRRRLGGRGDHRSPGTTQT